MAATPPPLASSRGNAIALVNAIRIAINRNLSNERSSALDRARELALDLAIAFAEDLAFASVNELARDRTLIHDLTFARDLALDLYFTLFLLWKRISGKLPPYEGILLIRELQDKDETT